MAAPVCNNAPVASVNQPTPKTLPTVPEAKDLQSALAAINAMRRILQTIVSQTPQHPGGISGFKMAKTQGFQEIKQRRVYKTVRVYNPQDHSQYVDVQQIVSMTMADPATGQIWYWQQ